MRLNRVQYNMLKIALTYPEGATYEQLRDPSLVEGLRGDRVHAANIRRLVGNALLKDMGHDMFAITTKGEKAIRTYRS